MGQDANGNEWTESNIPIPSMQVEVLGCTDPSDIIMMLLLILMMVVVSFVMI